MNNFSNLVFIFLFCPGETCCSWRSSSLYCRSNEGSTWNFRNHYPLWLWLQEVEFLCWLCLSEKQLSSEKISETNAKISETATDWQVRHEVFFIGWHLVWFIKYAGQWKYHTRLVRPGPISFRTSWNFLFTCLWTSAKFVIKLIKFCILYFD